MNRTTAVARVLVILSVVTILPMAASAGAAPPDPAKIVSVGDALVAEGDSGAARKVQFPITLSEPSVVPVTVGYAIYPDGSAATASSPGDLASKSGRVTFKPAASTGMTSTTRWVTATVRPDDIDESVETFRVEISDPTGDYVVGDATARGAIADDDPGSERHFDVGSVSIWEGRTGTVNAAKVPLTLSEPSIAAVKVKVTVQPMSASVGTDFKPVTTKILTFAPGQVQKFVTVNVLPDEVDEAVEDVQVIVSPASGGVVPGMNYGIVTIRDDDT